MALFPYIKKFNFKTSLSSRSIISNHILFLFTLFLPTKYGVKLFLKRFSLKNIKDYLIALFQETFGKKKIKNYYFNAMYRYNYCYRITYLININLFRRFLFYSKKNHIINIFYILSKIFIYIYLQFELIVLYFVRIYLVLSLYLVVRNKIQYMRLA